MFESSGIGGELTDVAARIRHSQVGNPDGGVLQMSPEKGDSILEDHTGETLSVERVEHSDDFSLAINRLPHPRHLDVIFTS